MQKSCEYHKTTDTYICGYRDLGKISDVDFLDMADEIYRLINQHTFRISEAVLEPIEFKLDLIAIVVTEGSDSKLPVLGIYNRKGLPIIVTNAVGDYVNDHTEWYYAGSEHKELFSYHKWLADNIAISYDTAMFFTQVGGGRKHPRKLSLDIFPEEMPEIMD